MLELNNRCGSAQSFNFSNLDRIIEKCIFTSGLTSFVAGAGTFELRYSVSLIKLTPAYVDLDPPTVLG